jgi:hypothetical protein
MGLYICPTCGISFNAPARDRYNGNSWDCCPYCGEPDFEESVMCVCCGEDFRADQLVGGLCPDCLEGEPDAQDYRDFAHDAQVRESFAEWLTEKHKATWERRRYGNT